MQSGIVGNARGGGRGIGGVIEVAGEHERRRGNGRETPPPHWGGRRFSVSACHSIAATSALPAVKDGRARQPCSQLVPRSDAPPPPWRCFPQLGQSLDGVFGRDIQSGGGSDGHGSHPIRLCRRVGGQWLRDVSFCERACLQIHPFEGDKWSSLHQPLRHGRLVRGFDRLGWRAARHRVEGADRVSAGFGGGLEQGGVVAFFEADEVFFDDFDAFGEVVP
jgi:hypothetical protein